MADLVTHLATVLLPAAFVRHRAISIVALGVVLPDLASRVPGEALEKLHELGAPVPSWAVMPWGVTHEPIPLLLVCVLVTLLFRERDRGVVLGALVLGCAAHLGLDLLQDHHGHGYHLLFPLHWGDWELGWLHSEATVAWAPWLASITGVAWAIRRLYRPTKASGNTPSSTPGPDP